MPQVIQINSMNRILTLLVLVLWSVASSTPPPSRIFLNLQKFGSLKKVLYVAAHPDDENTRALAWFSLGEKAETAYLSLTRGDGGQNLIGQELGEDLGVLRTQELLAARSYDGAEQYFSRAVDFGYSKSAEESFEKWGKDLILSEVVLMIRKFKPDVIITRFPPDERAGHGHHTASAILAIEAFDHAADPSYLPEQVEEHGTWQATSLYWNASNWWNNDIAALAKNNPDYLIKDIGGYNEHLGMSYNEIGTLARSQHKCQGFGDLLERGSRIEYFQYIKGTRLKHDFFENNTTSWKTMVSGSFQKKLDHLLNQFDFIEPSSNVVALIELKNQLEKTSPSTFRTNKLGQLNQIILDCMGLHAEIYASDYAFVDQEKSQLVLEVINRSGLEATLKSIDGLPINQKLSTNQMLVHAIEFENSAPLSTPYWLKHPFTDVFSVTNKDDFLKAQNDPTYLYPVQIEVNGSVVRAALPLEFKWKDPSHGERRRAAVSTPDYTATFLDKSIILAPGQTKTIELKIRSFGANLRDEITIEAPKFWELNQTKFPLNIQNKQEEQTLKIQLTATPQSQRGALVLKNQNGEIIKSFTEINYDHIPTQVIFKPSQLECIKIDAQIKKGRIAYIKGVEDVVPQAIAQLGFEVEVFGVDALSLVDLEPFQTVVLGIRAYNVHQELHHFEEKLFSYVKNGGNLIMQYNTASRAQVGTPYGGPLPFEISRNRVTEENAPVTFLVPEHPLLNVPNKITALDFDHWVQERGLYFASNWASSYQALLSWNDEGEQAQLGALIVAKHGKGQFIYTGISFFRELPHGVEGAYRLFANLLSYDPQ